MPTQYSEETNIIMIDKFSNTNNFKQQKKWLTLSETASKASKRSYGLRYILKNVGLSYVERMEEHSRGNIIYKDRQVGNLMLYLE